MSARKTPESKGWKPGPFTELKIIHAAAVLQGMPRKLPVVLFVDRKTFNRWARALKVKP